MHSVAARRPSSGMVLVITLLGLAAITIIILTMLVGVSHQLVGTRIDANLMREKILADTAVALVIGQVQSASTQVGQTWISQPGLLRTYGTNAVRAPTACYKLYSVPTLAGMNDTSGTLLFLTNDVPTSWSSSPSLYIDLNAPVQTAGASIQSIYPILDPSTLTNLSTAPASTTIVGVSSDTTNVAMPVAWLYELQDGTLGTTTNATAANPIVARVAFWTDDDTCKVNINTAGCGSPWNLPRFNSTNDVAWSTNQPAAGEYSAYPGHPATTSLAVVLGTNAWPPQTLLALTPRYAWGGTEFASQPTTNGEVVSPKSDRLYASLDELCFSTAVDGSGRRETNTVSAAQIERSRFVLTEHSVAPETTLLGWPRIAIWPVADSTSSSAPRITLADAAITNASTVGAGTTNLRSYFFQRSNPQNMLDDFDPNSTNTAAESNVELFNDLVARGNVGLPGYGTTFTAKYPGAAWSQVLLEIADFIHTLNAIDPSPAPFVPFAPGDASGAGRGFVEPLNWTYGSGTNAVTLRGLGRAPTLSSLTLVLYVSGFTYKNGNYVDFEQNPDVGGTNWNANFLPASTNWTNVVSERVRAFVVPCTFQPGCAYPEVSDACTIQIQGLSALKVYNFTNSGGLGFASNMTSYNLSDACKVSPADRAWGGNEGPQEWRAASTDAINAGPYINAFAGTNFFPVMLASSPTYNASTGLKWPPASMTAITNNPVTLTVLIQDAKTNTLQTIAATFPNLACPVPTPIAEFTRDSSNNPVAPSYYMTMRNRLLLTGTNREFLIQPGDVSRSLEAGTDLRVIAGLANVPASMFRVTQTYTSAQHIHNLHFSDGTGIYGAAGTNTVVGTAFHLPTTTTITWTNWCNNASSNYAWPVSAPNNSPTTPSATSVLMTPGSGGGGDWDTGPGLSPDGAEINLPDAGTTNSPAAAYFSLTNSTLGLADAAHAECARAVAGHLRFAARRDQPKPRNQLHSLADAALLSVPRRQYLGHALCRASRCRVTARSSHPG